MHHSCVARLVCRWSHQVGDYHGNHQVSKHECSDGYEHDEKDGPQNVVVAGLRDMEGGREGRTEGGREGGR